MTKGQCLCGAIKFTITGDPMASALCHCNDCRKTSGSAFAVNWVVLAHQVAVTGKPAEYTAPAKSGNPVTNHFCGACGTTLWRDGPATQGMMYVKAGTLEEDALGATRPVAEIFTKRRAAWVVPVEGAHQKEEME
ncbi:hypothetical protein ACHAQA_008570 [Verticillium albo-atrum]